MLIMYVVIKTNCLYFQFDNLAYQLHLCCNHNFHLFQTLIPQPVPTTVREDMSADIPNHPRPKPRQRRDKATPIIRPPNPRPSPSTPPHVAQMVEMGFVREHVLLATEVS